MAGVPKVLPILYACQGCAQFGQLARDTGQLLDSRNHAQMAWLGSARHAQPTDRLPVMTLDACAEACARRWVEAHGMKAGRAFVVGRELTPEVAAERIAAELAG